MKAPKWLWCGIGWGTVVLLWGAMAQPANASCRIIEIRGSGAALERRGVSGRGSALVGTVINVGDLVYPANGATVRLQCRTPGNRFTHPSRTRVFGLADVCPDCVSTRYADGSRGEDDFLLFLEDRFEYASQVVEDSPTFRWDEVPGVTAYRVQVWDCGQAVFYCTELLWQETVEGREVTYGGAALEPGRNYELVVSPETDPEQVLAYLTLRRLGAPQAEALQDSLAEVEAVELGPEAAALARANQYLAVAELDTLPPEGVGLVLDAIAELEAVACSSTTPYVHRLLGDLYLQAGLLAEAQGAYEQTLELPAAGRDGASRAAAQVGLANIAAAQDDWELARNWLQQAQESYGQLQDADRVAQVEDWLSQLPASEN